MEITQVNYPIMGKYKFNVIYKNKRYTCYICAFEYNLVVTGDGNSIDYKDITNTKLGTEIISACYDLEFQNRVKQSKGE